MKILFLDVDGVLNRCEEGPGLEEDKLAMLQWIVEATGCQIVVSSSWRLIPESYERLMEVLNKRGIPVRGVTPDKSRLKSECSTGPCERWEEITAWLEANPNVTQFAIVDDALEMGPLWEHFIRTKSNVGLTPLVTLGIIFKLEQEK